MDKLEKLKMNHIKSILIVTPDYPIDGEPVYPFVKNLCDEFVRKGCDVTILAPQSLTSRLRHRKIKRPVVRYDLVGENKVMIYQPYKVSFPYKYQKINNKIDQLCITHFLRKHSIRPDVCYGHFWRSGFLLLPFVKRNHLPLFVATGEGDLMKYAPVLTSHAYLEMNKYLSGVISVSSNNRNISQQLGLLEGKDCLVAPNAIDGSLYYRKDKDSIREKYGLSKEDFIVAFVGAFNNRKGSLRVSEAIDKVGGVKSFFIGSQGESELLEPTCEGILYKGRLPHEVIPDYLNMADIFVLPTLNEGCCNAIVEALACGLPIVSSNRPFNYDVLNETNSIMVNPMNVEEIASAIKELKDNQSRRKQLSEGALKTAEDLTIDRRAQKIINFMEQHINVR